MNPEKFLVVTSISSPGRILEALARGSTRSGIKFILIGDTKSPADFHLEGCDFWNIERQKSLNFKLAEQLPVEHYARKNLGYLLAMKEGAGVIIETDDDNFPYDSFWHAREKNPLAVCVNGGGWVNVYKYFTVKHIWPRGFPLEEIQKVPPNARIPAGKIFAPVQQGLADDNPDVDAIYRLVLPLPVKFDHKENLALGEGSWCPFNSQNTTWFREAFPLMYLPSFCSFRMTDIWRSFIAQRIIQHYGWHILFHSPTVAQDRNNHNLLKDFDDEVEGYLNYSGFMKAILGVRLKEGEQNMAYNIRQCYMKLIGEELMDKRELDLLDLWLNALDDIFSSG